MTDLDPGLLPPLIVESWDVACHVPGCVNADIVLRVPVSVEENSSVFCGPCGNEITDMVLVEEE